MRDVIVSDDAVAEIDEIVAYIASDKPIAAENIRRRLYDTAQSLSILPHREREIARGVRQLTTVAPYLIRYRVLRDGTVVILSVRHGARRR